MTMIQLIACIGMIAGLFMVLHVSPRELSDSLFARLTAAPGSIRADINETTKRKRAGFLRREITEAQAVLAASGRTDKFPLVCFTSMLCFALGACIAIAAGNAFLVPVLAVGLMLTPFWYVKLTAGSFKKDVAAELETALFVSSASMVLKLGIASVALTGSVLLVRGSIDVLTLFLFLMAASRMYDPMQGALQNLAAVIAMRTNVGRMNEILDAPLQTGSEQLTNQGCDIVFDHVGFAYNSGETVLRDVSFTAKQGEVTALVGPSGGGKTTVSRLAARFWDYQKGSITVGGMEVSQIDPEKLMSLYSIVFQDVTLFDNTILENIRLGRKGATDEEVLAAAKLANCEEFAEKLPDKWNTNIGENGCTLSGGERQRISIARAFLKDAPIILLDEATASLDVENETAIQEALSRLIKHKTVLIIAHRMRTVAGADKVVVLSGGIVAEQSSPAELYARKGLYTHMVDLQSASQNWTI